VARSDPRSRSPDTRLWTAVHTGACVDDAVQNSSTGCEEQSEAATTFTPIRATLRRSVAVVVYPSRVSEKAPQTYILHTVALFVVLAIVMVLFLKHQWG
jgi:hypothetical protein